MTFSQVIIVAADQQTASTIKKTLEKIGQLKIQIKTYQNLKEATQELLIPGRKLVLVQTPLGGACFVSGAELDFLKSCSLVQEEQKNSVFVFTSAVGHVFEQEASYFKEYQPVVCGVLGLPFDKNAISVIQRALQE